MFSGLGFGFGSRVWGWVLGFGVAGVGVAVSTGLCAAALPVLFRNISRSALPNFFVGRPRAFRAFLFGSFARGWRASVSGRAGLFCAAWAGVLALLAGGAVPLLCAAVSGSNLILVLRCRAVCVCWLPRARLLPLAFAACCPAVAPLSPLPRAPASARSVCAVLRSVSVSSFLSVFADVLFIVRFA